MSEWSKTVQRGSGEILVNGDLCRNVKVKYEEKEEAVYLRIGVSKADRMGARKAARSMVVGSTGGFHGIAGLPFGMHINLIATVPIPGEGEAD